MYVDTALHFQEPEPANVTKAAVDSFAAQVARTVGYTPGAELDTIVERLGGKIESDSWDVNSGSGSLEVLPGQDPRFIIRLPYFAGNVRNRFTVAHELGHFFLHSGGGAKAIKIAREGSDRCEWEANWFAAGFLLPADRFRQDWSTCRSIPRLANQYLVSQSVIEIRLKTLGLA